MIEFIIEEQDMQTHLTLNHERYEEAAEIHRFFQSLGLKVSRYYVDTPTRKGREEIVRSVNYLHEYLNTIEQFRAKGFV